jgi:ribose 5-phosphate isomerase B
MNIALGTDHGGFALKSVIAHAISRAGHHVLDCGADKLQPDDDYPVFSERVARAVQSHQADRGIIICGSGVGASVAANKVAGIRAALCHDTFSAHQGVEDDEMNVLCIGARVVGPSLAAELVTTFLGAKFSGAERHRRRLQMVKTIESGEQR